MSHELIDRSPDLKRLRDDGYNVSVVDGYLVMDDVPYVGEGITVKTGRLVSELTLAGNVTAMPSTHVVYFEGDYPRDNAGAEITAIRHTDSRLNLGALLTVDHSFSAKPVGGQYSNYYDKMTTYAAILCGPAAVIDPGITPRTFPVIEPPSDHGVFKYIDTASSRANIVQISRTLESGPIAIVGVGGTGSYVLDLLAKAPISSIHLFDDDYFLQHNAFRSPGAASVEDLRRRLKKVDFLMERYSAIHRSIVPHPYSVTADNADELAKMDFIFLCYNGGQDKKKVVKHLEVLEKPFIDVGLGIYEMDSRLGGIITSTISVSGHREHVWNRQRISFNEEAANQIYDRNIQVADLNALNAAIAVIRWKRFRGFYHDLQGEFFSAYTIDGNTIANDDRRAG